MNGNLYSFIKVPARVCCFLIHYMPDKCTHVWILLLVHTGQGSNSCRRLKFSGKISTAIKGWWILSQQLHCHCSSHTLASQCTLQMRLWLMCSTKGISSSLKLYYCNFVVYRILINVVTSSLLSAHPLPSPHNCDRAKTVEWWLALSLPCRIKIQNQYVHKHNYISVTHLSQHNSQTGCMWTERTRVHKREHWTACTISINGILHKLHHQYVGLHVGSW